jgi:formate/nitrite transporter
VANQETVGPHISLTDLRADPYSPAEMAGRAQTVGMAKARLDFLSMLMLGILAGAFIALGAQLATIVGTDATFGYGPSRLLVGVAFSLGLILVVIAGAELFTGNTLIVMAWLGRRVTTRQLLRNWGIVYLGNLIGALGTVLVVYYTRQWAFDGNNVGAGALSIANTKVHLGVTEAVMRGILCNALVNLAVWLCLSARSNVDKIVSIIPPIAAFVASGFEHSVANMYFIPIGILLRDNTAVLQAANLSPDAVAGLTWPAFLVDNLLPVTVGNVIGGALLVAAVYWTIYLRQGSSAKPAPSPAPPAEPVSQGSAAPSPSD